MHFGASVQADTFWGGHLGDPYDRDGVEDGMCCTVSHVRRAYGRRGVSQMVLSGVMHILTQACKFTPLVKGTALQVSTKTCCLYLFFFFFFKNLSAWSLHAKHMQRQVPALCTCGMTQTHVDAPRYTQCYHKQTVSHQRPTLTKPVFIVKKHQL